MKENNDVLHTKNGVQLVTESQAVNNALEQEKAGSLRVMYTAATQGRPHG